VWFKHRAWIPVAWLLSLANLASVWFAARPGEPWHASGHALLAVLFALGARHLSQRKPPAGAIPVTGQVGTGETAPSDPGSLQDVEGRLAEVEERLDFAERALVDVRNRVPLPPKG
jgi:hypothetical protein